MLYALVHYLQETLLFAYGTSLAVANKHHPQSRMIAYTIGGLLVFLTLPFIYSGTVYLLHDEFSSIDITIVRWAAILFVSTVITCAVLSIERSTIVLSDALFPHFAAHLAMFLIRTGMVFLFSVVIANKWVLNSYAGPIQIEILAEANKSQKEEFKNAKETFDVGTLEQRLKTAQNRSRELEQQFSNIPKTIVIETEKLNACKVESTTIRNALNDLQKIALRTDAQEFQLKVLGGNYFKKKNECNIKEQVISASVRQYHESIQYELLAVRAMVKETDIKFTAAEKSAIAQAMSRSTISTNALTLNGSTQEAFARLRERNKYIDIDVRNKALILAVLEILPLLLKILSWNSPIAMETRAILQIECKEFRDRLRDSIQKERMAKSMVTKSATPSASGFLYAKVSPYVAPASPTFYASNFHQ